ncbi:MAG: acyltransferase family protein [Mycobacteriaceae bacterium]|nr:acyltransferase family protein [Mycobacteriaceae bacterium]
MAEWDPEFTEKVATRVGPLIKRYFRAEVRGFEAFPSDGGALVVSNHSGGMFTPDVLVFAPAFYRRFGYDRPVYTLAHFAVLVGPTSGWLRRLGVIEANRENAGKALRSGAVVLVFPGGDYDSYRPTAAANVIDFGGRTGYVRTALAAGVPIVPTVSIGAQESQLFLLRGDSIARRLGLKRLLRTEIVPVTIGLPFGLSVFFPPNVPLPSKIITKVLEPIHIQNQFGSDPDIDAVDAHVRSVMQDALGELARERRFPMLG